jgi:hypothetical protein
MYQATAKHAVKFADACSGSHLGAHLDIFQSLNFCMALLTGKTLAVISGNGGDGFTHGVPFTTVAALASPF